MKTVDILGSIYREEITAGTFELMPNGNGEEALGVFANGGRTLIASARRLSREQEDTHQERIEVVIENNAQGFTMRG